LFWSWSESTNFTKINAGGERVKGGELFSFFFSGNHSEYWISFLPFLFFNKNSDFLIFSLTFFFLPTNLGFLVFSFLFQQHKNYLFTWWGAAFPKLHVEER